MSNVAISVVLAAYSPRADYLQRTLSSVRQQSLSHERWEFLVIDNNSKPPLAEGVELAGLPDARIIVEREQGLSHARRRGFQEARGEVIVNVDDDCVLAPDFLVVAERLVREMPFIGVFGCSLASEFEVAPPVDIGDYYGHGRPVSSDMWSNDPAHFASTPGGAGSIVRRPVADAFVTKMLTDPRWGMLGRSGGNCFSCEDIEISSTACDLGFGKGVFRDLRITHLIPADRMTREFEVRNAYGLGYSAVLHAFLRHGAEPERPRLLSRFNRLYRLIRMSPRMRRAEMSKDRGLRDARRFVAELKTTEHTSQEAQKGI